MVREPALVDVWANRHKSSVHRKACKDTFTVAKANVHLRGVSEDISNLVHELYNAAIDYGAHPNLRSIFAFVSIDDERDDGYVGVNLAGLHSADANATATGLVACLDLGFAIAAVITLAQPDPSDALVAALQNLNDLKNRVEGELAA